MYSLRPHAAAPHASVLMMIRSVNTLMHEALSYTYIEALSYVCVCVCVCVCTYTYTYTYT
jgi:hypothetical protein